MPGEKVPKHFKHFGEYLFRSSQQQQTVYGPIAARAAHSGPHCAPGQAAMCPEGNQRGQGLSQAQRLPSQRRSQGPSDGL